MRSPTPRVALRELSSLGPTVERSYPPAVVRAPVLIPSPRTELATPHARFG